MESPKSSPIGRHVIVFADQRPPMTPSSQSLLSGIECRALSNSASDVELTAAMAEADVIVTGLRPIRADTLAAASRLKGIVASGAGYDHVDVAAATARNVVVTCTPGANAISVAELTLALIFNLARRVHLNSQAVSNGEWINDELRWRFQGCEVFGKTLGLLGFGHVGQAIAARAAALGMRVLPATRNPSSERAAQAGVTFVSTEAAVSEADFLVAACAVTPETRGMINTRLLGQMKPTAYFINVARGAVVDDKALVEGLRARTIAGAAVDVLDREPPGPHHPFFGVENLIVTSHLGGRTDEAQLRLTLMVAEESLRILRGEMPQNHVNGKDFSWDPGR